jgi:hypothetical protein
MLHLHRCPGCGVSYRCASMEARSEQCVPLCLGCDVPALDVYDLAGPGVPVA